MQIIEEIREWVTIKKYRKNPGGRNKSSICKKQTALEIYCLY
jgi:hypothetical protein